VFWVDRLKHLFGAAKRIVQLYLGHKWLLSTQVGTRSLSVAGLATLRLYWNRGTARLTMSAGNAADNNGACFVHDGDPRVRMGSGQACPFGR
ncbi:MAG: hypothetical protein ACU0BJ_12555, partial [Shimia sp.]|uniref:hypothetical protein n=1 Tax=Shimia sp. TaxID=1954381 RepID=UPI00405A2C56